MSFVTKSMHALRQHWRLAVMFLLLVGAVLILFTPSKLQFDVPDGFVRVQYWEKWTGEEGRQMKIIVDDFNNTVGKEKKIFIEYISMSSIDQKTLVATAAGVPPDIAGVWDAQVLQFAAMDALEPLDDLAKEYGITRETYKPVLWDGCTYQGKLWALISTPAAIVLHYDKAAFLDSADKIRAAGLDPDSPPQTIEALDRYAECMTTYDPADKTKIKRSGHLPMEPGWYIPLFPYWFGGDLFNESDQTLTVDTTNNVKAYDWIASYSRKYGKASFDSFRSGLGNFASAQNGFLVGTVAMEQQGPWMANYIELNAPQLNRWNVPAEKLEREKNFPKLKQGMAETRVRELLGEPVKTDGRTLTWDAGIQTITCTFDDSNTLKQTEMKLIPALERRKYCQWGAAPFPNSVSKDKLVAFCPFDAFVIPRGAKHKREAFEFMAYVNRQDVMEKLCMLHCKTSALAKVSDRFLNDHPNAYIGVFEEASLSPDAFTLPQTPIWPEVADELNSDVAQTCYSLAESAQDAMKRTQARLDRRWDYFREVQTKRRGS